MNCYLLKRHRGPAWLWVSGRNLEFPCRKREAFPHHTQLLPFAIHQACFLPPKCLPAIAQSSGSGISFLPLMGEDSFYSCHSSGGERQEDVSQGLFRSLAVQPSMCKTLGLSSNNAHTQKQTRSQWHVNVTEGKSYMDESFSQGTSGIGLEGVFLGGGVGSGLFSHPRGLCAQEMLAGCQLTLRKASLESSQNSPMYSVTMF